MSQKGVDFCGSTTAAGGGDLTFVDHGRRCKLRGMTECRVMRWREPGAGHW